MEEGEIVENKDEDMPALESVKSSEDEEVIPWGEGPQVEMSVEERAKWDTHATDFKKREDMTDKERAEWDARFASVKARWDVYAANRAEWDTQFASAKVTWGSTGRVTPQEEVKEPDLFNTVGELRIDVGLMGWDIKAVQTTVGDVERVVQTTYHHIHNNSEVCCLFHDLIVY